LVTIATEERAALAAALHAAGPDAPTLCEGWTTHDLAAHLWFRENDPRAMLGIVVPSLAESQLERVKQERPYSELVDAFAAGPTRLSPFAIAKVDEVANAPEFFVHHEDVRRGDGAVRPRTLGDDVQAWAWPVATVPAGSSAGTGAATASSPWSDCRPNCSCSRSDGRAPLSWTGLETLTPWRL
jgi:uncharacterized protein (TIGR03085 family)